MANGHDAESAEHVMADVPAWRGAPAEGLAVFADACARLWAEIATGDPADWRRAMAHAAREWATHRRPS